MKVTIANLKSSKVKDSSNSSKPSSTNSFKKVIQNNRVKSGKSKGDQKGRVGKTLNEVETIEYRYYVGKCEKCGKEYVADIPKELENPVQYSSKIKSLVPVVKNMANISVETPQTLFATLFNGFKPSIGWIHSQDKNISKKSEPVL